MQDGAPPRDAGFWNALSINVCFSTTDGLLSRIIRGFTRSQVSHALITFRDSTLQRVLVMEASGRGYVMVPWRRWRKRNELVCRFRISEAHVSGPAQQRALAELSDALGDEFDTSGLVGFWFLSARKRLRLRPFNLFADSRKLFCSEAVARFLGSAGVAGFDEPDTWSPAALMAELRRRREFVEVADSAARLVDRPVADPEPMATPGAPAGQMPAAVQPGQHAGGARPLAGPLSPSSAPPP